MIKNVIKEILADMVYKLYSLKKPTVTVYSIDETLDKLIHSDMSLVRFGDGEILMISGKNIALQNANLELSEELKRILKYEHDGLLVTVQGVFDGLRDYRKESRRFWKDHLLFFRSTYQKYCSKNKIYGDTAVTRCYYSFQNKDQCREWFERFKSIWKDKSIVVVEGSKTHNGAGNDLFNGAGDIERIICPPQNAYSVKHKILEICFSYSQDKLFLLSLGAAAKGIAEALYLKGYRVIDIGNLDLEYEWYLKKAAQKEPIKKHEIIGEEANRKAEYFDYLDQIKFTVKD